IVVVVVGFPSVVGTVVVVKEAQASSPCCLQSGRMVRRQSFRDCPVTAMQSAIAGLQAFRHFRASPAVAQPGIAARTATKIANIPNARMVPPPMPAEAG